LDMCPAQHGHVHAHAFARLSLPMKHKLRLLPWWSLFGLTTTPCDELGKALLCQTEGFPTEPYHAWFHALIVRCDVQDYPPVGWRFVGEILLFSCYCLLVSCGLLLACPSPPGSAPGTCPSPPGKLLVPALLLLIRGCSTLPPSSASRDSIPGFGLLDVVWCCENLVFSWLLCF
jgi:hypothetical protein